MEFKYNLTVRGYELDSFNHLNNAVYLNYIEQARWQILKELNLLETFQKNNLNLFVIETNIRYIREAKIFDNLEIRTTTALERPYLVFTHKIYNSKTKLKIARCLVKLLFVDNEKTPLDIPAVFLNKLNLKQ